MEPSSTDLKYFLEVAREGNMSKAAYKLGISQPSLSLAIQRIEKCLEARILLRDRTGAKPTAVGINLIRKTQKLLEAWGEVREIIKEHTYGKNTSIVIGCHPEVAIDSLPLFMPQLLKDRPNLEVRLIHDLSRVITQQVIDGKVDIGLVVNPRPFPDLIIKTLSYDFVGLWVAKNKNPKELETLICQPELAQSQKVMRQSSKKGLKFQRIILSSNIQVIASLTASGCGVGILPSEVALRNPSLNLLPLPSSPVVKDRVALIYRQENRTSKLIKAAITEILVGHEKKYGNF